MLLKRIVLIAVCAAALIFCQCLYFNVYYNAKASYDVAYREHHKLLKNNPDSTIAVLPAEIQTNYDRSIEKCTKILEEFPQDVKWHDDAYFLMGMANFYKGEYEKTLRNVARLQEDYPQSPYIPESYLFTGKAYLRLGSLDRAEQTFTMILEKYPRFNDNQEVSLLMVEIALSREGKSIALELLEKTSAKVASKERKIELLIRTAGLAMDLKQYDKAIALLKSCPRDKKFPNKLYLIDLALVGCHEAKDSLNEAMRITDVMIGNKLYGAYVPEIMLKKAAILVKMGKTEDAIGIYMSIVNVYAPAPAAGASPPPGGSKPGLTQTTPAPPPAAAAASSTTPTLSASNSVSLASGQAAAGSALFELGLLYQIKKGDFAKAKEYFSRAISITQDSVVRSNATLRVKSLDSLFAYRTLRDTTDTLKTLAQRNALDFKIGELFWLELDLPDSAYARFSSLALRSDSLRPKALYSASYIARSGLRDTVKSDSLYAILLKRYPAGEYTKRAQIDRGTTVTVRTRLDSANEAYVSAESLYCYVNNSEASASAFKKVYETYPESPPGLKALYASAWINDEVLKNNKTAYKIYRMFCDSFPKCDICLNTVKPRLQTVADTLAARKARKKPGEKISTPQKPKPAITAAQAQTVKPVVATPPDAPAAKTIQAAQSEAPVAKPNPAVHVDSLPIAKPPVITETENKLIDGDSSEVIGQEPGKK
jgi:tetratricopeptide (TPR) repeat protein